MLDSQRTWSGTTLHFQAYPCHTKVKRQSSVILSSLPSLSRCLLSYLPSLSLTHHNSGYTHKMSWLPGALDTTTRSAALLISCHPARRLRAWTWFHHHHSATRRKDIHSSTHAASPHTPIPHLPHHLHHWPLPTTSRTSEPLHILFCGSDELSCASLEALHQEHIENPDLIRSINVVLRPGKPTGRGYKSIRDRESQSNLRRGMCGPYPRIY